LGFHDFGNNSVHLYTNTLGCARCHFISRFKFFAIGLSALDMRITCFCLSYFSSLVAKKKGGFNAEICNTNPIYGWVLAMHQLYRIYRPRGELEHIFYYRELVRNSDDFKASNWNLQCSLYTIDVFHSEKNRKPAQTKRKCLMKSKALVIQILIRFGILLIPLLAIYLLMVFTYNPHAHCIGNEHRHTMGPVGYVIFAVMVTVFWCLAMLTEITIRLFKKDKRIAYLLIFVLVFAGACIAFLI